MKLPNQKHVINTVIRTTIIEAYPYDNYQKNYSEMAVMNCREVNKQKELLSKFFREERNFSEWLQNKLAVQRTFFNTHRVLIEIFLCFIFSMLFTSLEKTSFYPSPHEVYKTFKKNSRTMF